MNNFIVRVELHGGTYNDYLALHTAMGKFGFSRVLTAASGTKYFLPEAEYIINSNQNVTAIKNAAKTAANSTKKTSWILATQVAAIDWDLAVSK